MGRPNAQFALRRQLSRDHSHHIVKGNDERPHVVGTLFMVLQRVERLPSPTTLSTEDTFHFLFTGRLTPLPLPPCLIPSGKGRFTPWTNHQFIAEPHGEINKQPLSH